MKIYNKILIYIVFLCLVVMPILAFSNFKFADNADFITTVEKRNIIEFSDVLESNNKRSAFEDFFEDNTPFRKQILSSYSNMLHSINVPIYPTIIYGKNHFFFLNRVEQYHRGKIPVDYDKVNTANERIKKLNAYITGKNITFAFAAMPDKASIYPEYLPDWYTGMETTSQNEAVINSCIDSGYTFFPDLTKILQGSKSQYGDYLYSKTDAHFSLLGNYICYMAIMDTLNSDYQTLDLTDYRAECWPEGYELRIFSGITKEVDDYKIYLEFSNYTIDNDWYRNLLNEDNKFQEDYEKALFFHNENALNNKTLIYIGDSFMEYQQILITATFENTYCFHITDDMKNLSMSRQLIQLIEEIQPDAIIIETVERSLSERANIFLSNSADIDTVLNEKNDE